MRSLYTSNSRPHATRNLKVKIVRILLFIFLFFVCDRLIFFILNAGFERTTAGETVGIVNRFLQEKTDIAIFGSSRAVHHYDTRVLSTRLNMSAYNAGCNGQELYYVRGVVDLSLKRNKPLLAIINIDATGFSGASKDLSRAMSLAPYMGESDVIREMLCSRGTFESLKFVSLAYRFNSKPLAIVKNLFAKDRTVNGFDPLYGVFDPEKVIGVNHEKTIGNLKADPAMISLLKKIILQLREAGVHTVLVHSPRWTRSGVVEPKLKPVLQKVIKLAEEEQVPFLAVTLENTPVFQSSEFFKDAGHLNAEGARLFSEILAAKLSALVGNQFQPVYDEL
jgi:hypothetical protein